MSPWPRRFFYGLLFVTPVGLLGSRHWRGENELFVPGRTSEGHHQIESQCANCHDPFGGAQDEACLACHGQSLKARNDSHAPSKFDDPARSAQLAVVDARSCVACHREHRAEARLRGSVSVPTTFCIGCHAEVRQERPSHTEFSDSGCASAGCHNYHDNRALYRDFLAKDRGGPRLRADPRVPTRAAFDGQAATPPPPSLPAPDLPATFNPDPSGETGSDSRWASNILPAITEWSQSAHAQAGVNCSGCHQRPPAKKSKSRRDVGGSAAGVSSREVWNPLRVPGNSDNSGVADTVCANCHRDQRLGFRAGKHGMRLSAGFGPMSPGMARAPMKVEASSRTLGCTSCHGAHRFDRTQAAVSACEGCHNDEHTRSYRASAHFTAWLKEQRQQAPAGTGVSCATCHLPRFALPERPPGQPGPAREIRVEHNQNGNLRPNDRMWREVCIHCHSASFSLAALVDPGLVMGNFTGEPSPALTSMDLIEKEKTDAKR